MRLRARGSLSTGLYVRGCLAHVLQTSFYLIIKFWGKKKKRKKLCKEESRYSLVVVCPDYLPSLEVEVLFFPVFVFLGFFPTVVAVRFYSASIVLTGQGSVGTRTCSPQYLPFLPCLSQMYITWQGELLFLLGAQLKQELSNIRASMFESGHAGNCPQQGVIFF